MDNSIRRTMLPLSISCVLVGFYSPHVTRSRYNKVVAVYCCLLAMVFVTHWATSTVDGWTSMYCCSFRKVTRLLGQAVRIATVTYYCIKYIVHHQVITDVYDNIDCAVTCLERIGVTVGSRKRDQLECTVYTGVITALYIIFFCFVPSLVQDTHATQIGTFFVLRITVVLWVVYAKLILYAQFTFVLYTIMKRIRLLRHAVREFGKRFTGRTTAWSSNIDVPSARGINSLTEYEYYWKEITKIDSCLYDAFSKSQTFLSRILYIKYTGLRPGDFGDSTFLRNSKKPVSLSLRLDMFLDNSDCPDNTMHKNTS